MKEGTNYRFDVTHKDKDLSFAGVEEQLKNTNGVESVSIYPESGDLSTLVDQPITTIEIETELSEEEALELVQGIIGQCIGIENIEDIN